MSALDQLPRPIRNDREFDRMVARLEELDFAKRKLTQEEKALREILAAPIGVYDADTVTFRNSLRTRWSST